MSGAARRLGAVLVDRAQGAADARWLTIGTVAGLEPLEVAVAGDVVPVAAFVGGTYLGAIGDVVLVGVLRGSPAVSYVVFGKMRLAPGEPPPAEAVNMTLWFGEPGVADYDTGHLEYPHLMRSDPDGNLYVHELGQGRIRKITPAGVATTAAFESEFTGLGADFETFDVVDVDDLYVAGDGRVWRKSPGGTVTHIAGVTGGGYLDGSVGVAQFGSDLYGLSVNSDGSLILVSDFGAPRLRKVVSAATVSTLAGSGSAVRTDGTGTGASYQYNYPDGVVDGSGNYWSFNAPSGNALYIRKTTPAGVVTTPVVLDASVHASTSPTAGSMCFAPNGKLYASFMVTSSSTAFIISYDPATTAIAVVHTYSRAFLEPTCEGMAVGADGALYLSIRDGATRGHTIQRLGGVT